MPMEEGGGGEEGVTRQSKAGCKQKQQKHFACSPQSYRQG